MNYLNCVLNCEFVRKFNNFYNRIERLFSLFFSEEEVEWEGELEGEGEAANRLALSTQHQLAEAARWPMVAAVAGPDEADDADCTEACKLQFMSTPKHTDNVQLEDEQEVGMGKGERGRGKGGNLLEGGLRPLRKLTICNSGVDVSAVPAVKFIQCRKIKTLVLSQGTHTHTCTQAHTHTRCSHQL